MSPKRVDQIFVQTTATYKLMRMLGQMRSKNGVRGERCRKTVPKSSNLAVKWPGFHKAEVRDANFDPSNMTPRLFVEHFCSLLNEHEKIL